MTQITLTDGQMSELCYKMDILASEGDRPGWERALAERIMAVSGNTFEADPREAVCLADEMENAADIAFDQHQYDLDHPNQTEVPKSVGAKEDGDSYMEAVKMLKGSYLKQLLADRTIRRDRGGIFSGRYVGLLPSGVPIILGTIGDEDAFCKWLVEYPTAEDWVVESNVKPKAKAEPLTKFQKDVIDYGRTCGFGESIDSGTYDEPTAEYTDYLLDFYESLLADIDGPTKVLEYGRNIRSLRLALDKLDKKESK